MIGTWHTGHIRAGTETATVDIGLVYYPRDPYAVTMCVDLGDGRAPITWRYARSLIEDALTDGQAGIGLVHLVVARHLTDNPWLWITIDGTDGRTALTALPAQQVHDWLTRTYQAVPAGAETLDVDQDLLRLPPPHRRPPRQAPTRPAGRAPTGRPPHRHRHARR